MLIPTRVQPTHRQRVLAGADGWWFVGPGGVARLKGAHLDGDGGLKPGAEGSLRAAGLLTAPTYRTYALTVLTSTDCNLGCAYCFQNTGQDDAGGNRPPRIAHSRLKPETIDAVARFTRDRMAEGGFEKLTLMLFGGEPLLNARGCRELLRRTGELNLDWAAMTSNGVLLTPPLARELHALGLRSVQITLDGDQPDHDRIRVRRSGGGTFAAILDNLARIGETTPLHWDLRVNVSHHNRAGIDSLLDRLAGRLDPARCGIYFARVGDVGIGYANDLLHSGALAGDFIRWHRRAVDLGFQVPRPRAETPCQACSFDNGRYGAVVNADGTLYSCWESSGKPGWEVGHVHEGYLPVADVADRWVSCEEKSHSGDEAVALRQFQDAVDGALLDALSAAGRL